MALRFARRIVSLRSPRSSRPKVTGFVILLLKWLRADCTIRTTAERNRRFNHTSGQEEPVT
jgi:hypothetical protein